MAYKFDEQVSAIVLNKNQEFLKHVNMLIGSSSNPGNIVRLKAAREDILSKLSVDELKEVEASMVVRKTTSQLAAEMREMEMNRDKESI